MEEPLIQWSSAFALGHEGLDREHKRLAGLINAIHSADRARQSSSRLNVLLSDLLLATIGHFRHENWLLRTTTSDASCSASQTAVNNSAINEHYAQHARALVELETIVTTIRADPGAGIGESLRDWFVEHATKHDAHLKAFFGKERREGGEADAAQTYVSGWRRHRDRLQISS